MSSDICGPISPPSRQGNKYFMTLIDTKSRYLIVDFMPNRQGVDLRMKNIISKIRSTHHNAAKNLTADNAKEYLSKAATTLYSNMGINHSTSLPYPPQQNGIAERINATLITAARAALHHSKLPLTFWEDAVRGAAFKYNCTRHSATKQVPFTEWFGTPPAMKHVYIFGQLGTTPRLTDKNTLAKLHSRADPCRYLFPSNETSITILNMKTNRAERARAIDFIPYDSQTDPAATTSAAFKSFTMHTTPKLVNTTTHAPKTHGQAKRYPDAALWAEAHDNELNHIDDQNIINWIPDSEVPKGTRLIPLTMTYRYKRDERGTIISRKARCSIRGDQMQANIHYDPDSTTTYTADKATVRLLLAIAATFEMHLDHLDITAPYLHEKFAQTGTEKVYVKQFARFDGSMRHSATAGILNGNLYGGPTAGNTYLEAVFSLLRHRKFQLAYSSDARRKAQPL